LELVHRLVEQLAKGVPTELDTLRVMGRIIHHLSLPFPKPSTAH
jgi:hypothetical protein